MHSEHSKTNGSERLAWPESHTENRGFAKEESAGDGTGALYGGRAMRPTERTFKNKRSGAIGVAGVTRKIEEEASQKNQADEIGRGGQWPQCRAQSETTAARRIGVTSVIV